MASLRRPSLLALFLVLTASAATASESATNRYSLPQIADGRFGGGSIQTTFVLFNNGRGTASVRLSIRDDAGEPLTATIPELGTAADFEFALAQGEVRFLQTDANRAARAGSAEVLSDRPIGVSAIFTLSDPQGDFLTQSGIAASPESSSLKLAVDVGEGLNTGVAIRNPDPQNPVNLTLTLRDSDGLERGAPARLTIPPGGHTAQFVSGQLFSSLGAFQGSLELEADGPVSALAIRQHDGPLSFTTLPVSPGDSPQLEFSMPQVANAPVARSAFVLFNLDSTGEALVTIRLTGSQGEPFSVQLEDGQEGSEFSIRIPPGGTRFLSTTGLGDSGAGAARISSSAPLGVSGIVTLLDDSGGFLSETGVGASPRVLKATIPVAGASTQTGLALFNDNPQPALISVRFNERPVTAGSVSDELDFDAGGPVEVPPFGHFAVFVPQFALDVEGRTGSLAISSTLPVSVQALLQTGDPLAFTTLPAAEGIAATVTPSALALQAQHQGVDLTADLTLDQDLPGGLELSGGVLLFGTAQRVLSVSAMRESDGRFFGGAVAGGPDRYRIVLPAEGVYTLIVHYSLGPDFFFPAAADPAFRAALKGAAGVDPRLRLGTAPSVASVLAVSETRGVVVEGDSLRNLRIPTVSRRLVSGRVLGLDAIPEELLDVPGTIELVPTVSGVTTGLTDVNQDGSFRIELAEGRYAAFLLLTELEVRPAPRVRQVVTVPLGEVSVSASGAAPSFTLPELVRVSGTVSYPYSAEIPQGAAVFAAGLQSSGSNFGSALAPILPDGSYRFSLVRDQGYRFSVSATLESPEGGFSLPRPVNAPIETFSQDAVRNFSSFPPLPPTVTLSGRVTGPSGPLADAFVTAVANGVSGAPDLSFGASARTDSDGRYSLVTLSATGYFVTFWPR